MVNVIKMDCVPSHLNDAMDKFERQFRYPLGHDRTFRISHGDDYGRFFRAIGKSRLYIARNNDEILGSLAVVERPLNHGGQQVKSLYIGDLKILPKRGGRTLYRLILEAYEDHQEDRDMPQYGIMMMGSPRTPSDYTGRLGLPPFEKLSEIAILRTLTTVGVPVRDLEEVSLHEAADLAAELHESEWSLPLTRATLRSSRQPRAFKLKDGSAVAVLEDTLDAKRLYDDSNAEIISGHLSSLHYSDASAAVRLIRKIARVAGEHYPALFFAVPVEIAHQFTLELPVHVAPAFVYGRNLQRHCRWQVNTAEI